MDPFNTMKDRPDGTMKRARQSSISFGTVSLYKFDTTAKARRAVREGCAVPKRISVEEFERFHRMSAKKSKTPLMVSTLLTDEKSRSEQLERLRRQIEATLDATDSIIPKADETCSGNDNPNAHSPLVLTKKIKDERWVASALIGGPTKLPPRITTRRSSARLSQLHLSRLNLTTLADTSVTRPSDGTNMKNAVFPHMVGALSSSDAAPKRPTRKRSRDCLATQETLEKRSTELGVVNAPAVITLQNATWESHVRPWKKRSRDCLLQKTFVPPPKGDFADTHNAVW